MNALKHGDIVKFHTPNPDEDPEQLYVMVSDVEKGRADIQALNTGTEREFLASGHAYAYVQVDKFTRREVR